jgi:hypothetical protein
MTLKSKNLFQQPWFHSPLIDSVGMFAIPLFIILTIMFFGDIIGKNIFIGLAAAIGFIDYGHSWISWVRVKTNPLETKKHVYLYILSYIAFFIILSGIFLIPDITLAHKFLVYFAIIHFIRQQYGVIKIYSKTDGAKTKNQTRITDLFVYLTMAYPIIWWHAHNGNKKLYWKAYLIDIPYINIIENILLITYIISGLFYLYYEFKITQRNKAINLPKNITLLSTIICWTYSIMYSELAVSFMFAVIYSHNITYFIIIWSTARRDYLLQGYKFSEKFIGRFFNWRSYEGFWIYFFGMNLIAAFILSIYVWITHGNQIKIIFFKLDYSWIPTGTDINSIYFAIISGLYFATHANHYFIDAFLWKKEKDYAWHLKNKGPL